MLNCYVSLLNSSFEKIYAFHTRFLDKRFQKAWKDVQIFTKDILFFPCNIVGSHWYLIAVFIFHKEVYIIDSMSVCDVQEKGR